MINLEIQISKLLNVSGKSQKGKAFHSVIRDILEYDRCTRILIEKSGPEVFVRHLEIPETCITSDGRYEYLWRHNIWQAAWDAWQEVKNKK